jgi:hypothetical protein
VCSVDNLEMLPFLSKRWETIWFLAMGVCINYCIRVNVSIAAQEMTDDLNWTEAQKGELLYDSSHPLLMVIGLHSSGDMPLARSRLHSLLSSFLSASSFSRCWNDWSQIYFWFCNLWFLCSQPFHANRCQTLF